MKRKVQQKAFSFSFSFSYLVRDTLLSLFVISSTAADLSRSSLSLFSLTAFLAWEAGFNIIIEA